MSVISASISDIHLVEGVQDGIGARSTYKVVITCGTMTAGDTATVTAANTAIGNILKNGKTLTLRQCMGAGPGLTPGGTAAYALAATISTASIDFSVGGVTAAAAVANLTKVSMFVSVDES